MDFNTLHRKIYILWTSPKRLPKSLENWNQWTDQALLRSQRRETRRERPPLLSLSLLCWRWGVWRDSLYSELEHKWVAGHCRTKMLSTDLNNQYSWGEPYTGSRHRAGDSQFSSECLFVPLRLYSCTQQRTWPSAPASCRLGSPQSQSRMSGSPQRRLCVSQRSPHSGRSQTPHRGFRLCSTFCVWQPPESYSHSRHSSLSWRKTEEGWRDCKWSSKIFCQQSRRRIRETRWEWCWTHWWVRTVLSLEADIRQVTDPTNPLRRTSGGDTDGWCSAQLRSTIVTPPPHILSAQSPYLYVM